ncbi:MAG: addiction module protein [Chitinophagales bacterium]|nr:addiction module protein [Chitinophagales bacterium]
MQKSTSIDAIFQWSAAEKILLVEKIWDSIHPKDIGIPESQIIESRRRIEAIRKGEVSASSWDEVRKRIDSRL